MSFELFVSIMMQCLICVLWKLITLTWVFIRCLITWSCCLWASQCDAQSVYVSITCAYRAVTALLMRLFSSSDKHSLQKICSQHFIQINLVVDSQEVSVINNMKAIIISFIKKQICKETKVQWLKIWKSSIKKKNQYWKIISNVNLSHELLKELRKIDRLTFLIFIQLKMKHDYFKSYLHRLSKNNSNKCYEICNARQMLKHLLLNCRHYKAEQRKLKKKAQLKNTNIILILFIIKIERIATLKYLKNTWITTRK